MVAGRPCRRGSSRSIDDGVSYGHRNGYGEQTQGEIVFFSLYPPSLHFLSSIGWSSKLERVLTRADMEGQSVHAQTTMVLIPGEFHDQPVIGVMGGGGEQARVVTSWIAQRMQR